MDFDESYLLFFLRFNDLVFDIKLISIGDLLVSNYG